MAEHSKLPWEAKGQQIRDKSEHGVPIAYCGVVAGAGVCKDGKIRSFGIDEEAAIANAKFICKAVNNHEALVTELRRARARIEYLGAACASSKHFDANYSEFLPRIDAVLNAVVGGVGK